MPFISKDFINDLPQQVDIIDLINKRVPLKKAGKNYKACCPFHNEKTPSFSVSQSKQMYKCFGCGQGGGAIDFVMKFDHLDFKEAVEAVANEAGISVVYDTKMKPVDSKIKRYKDLMKQVAEFYQQQLSHSIAKNKIIHYMQKRGISTEISQRFQLGFAPPGENNLFTHFKADEQAIIDLQAMGLLKDDQFNKSKYYEPFRDRLMFPIHNSKGEVIAFGGRILSADAKPKYLNSPQTAIFSKSKELYSLYHCRKHTRNIDCVLVVEGYMDVVALNQGGFTNVVATLGTATTTEHLQTLSRTSNRIIFCFDGDKAGRAAAWKALQIALPVIKAGLMFGFLFLPDGEDPDTLIKKESQDKFKKRIENALPLSKFLFNHIKEEVDFKTIEGKTAFLEQASMLIQQVNYEAYQRQLIEGIAELVKQDVAQVDKIFNQQILDTKTVSAAKENDVAADNFADMPIYDTPISSNKRLMATMISLLINYPTLADDAIETRVKMMKGSQVLLELLHFALADGSISIEKFKPQTVIYKRLQKLSVLSPYLTEKQARREFLDALSAIEKYQKNLKIKALITTSNDISAEQQKQIVEAIKKNKTITSGE